MSLKSGRKCVQYAHRAGRALMAKDGYKTEQLKDC